VLGRIALIVAVATLAAGCTTFESGSVWHIKLRNDSTHLLVVKDCANSACATFRYVKRLAPGKTFSALDYGDGNSRWVVMGQNGRRLGCLTLGIDKRVDGYVLQTSAMTSRT
jgi:hypothetical protein